MLALADGSIFRGQSIGARVSQWVGCTVSDFLTVIQERYTVKREVQDRGSVSGPITHFQNRSTPIVIVVVAKEQSASWILALRLLPLIPYVDSRRAIAQHRTNC